MTGLYVLTESLEYYSSKLDEESFVPEGTIIEATGRHSAKAGDEFIVNGEPIWITDAEEIIEEV